MGITSEYNPNNVEGMQTTDSGDQQRIVFTNAISGTTTLSGKESVTVLVKERINNSKHLIQSGKNNN